MTAAAVGAAIAAVTPTGARRDYTPRVLFGRPTPPTGRGRKVVSKVRKKAKSAKAFFKQQRQEFGAPAGFDTCKRAQTHDPTNLITLGTQSMNCYEVTGLTKAGQINSRERDSVFLSGIKIYMNAEFAATNSRTARLNWAVISPKNAATVTSTDTNFFKDYGATRAWNAAATNKTGLSWAMAKINLDEYHVFGQGYCWMGAEGSQPAPSADTANIIPANNMLNNEAYTERYVPIGRTITFASTVCNERIYIALWGGMPMADSGVSNYNDTARPFLVRLKTITYFREPEKIKI